MKCKTCSHPQRQAIDQALLAGNATYADLSQQHGLSISSLFRHKKSLNLKMARAREKLQHSLHQDCLFHYNEYLETTRQIVRTAGAEGNTRLALQAVRAGSRILNFITKLDVQLDQETVYRILASPQWTTQDSLLPTGSKIITDGHQTLADDLFYPCPELPSALEDALAQEENAETALETGPRKQANLPAKPETPPQSQRENSAKLPKKTPHSGQINEQYQYHELCEKNPAKISPGGRESAAPPAAKASGAQPVELLDQNPKTGNQQFETRNSILGTFFQRWPRLVSALNPKPKKTSKTKDSPWLGFAFQGFPDDSPLFPEYVDIYTIKDP